MILWQASGEVTERNKCRHISNCVLRSRYSQTFRKVLSPFYFAYYKRIEVFSMGWGWVIKPFVYPFENFNGQEKINCEGRPCRHFTMVCLRIYLRWNNKRQSNPSWFNIFKRIYEFFWRYLCNSTFDYCKVK